MTAITLLFAAMLYFHKLSSQFSSKLKNNGNSAEPEKTRAFIGRFEGTLLILAYATYYYYLFPAS